MVPDDYIAYNEKHKFIKQKKERTVSLIHTKVYEKTLHDFTT